MFEIFRRGLHNATAGVGGAGKTNLSDSRIDKQFFADHAAGTGDDVQDAFRAAGVLDCFIDDLAGTQISERRRAGGFDDYCITRKQRWTELVAH